MDDKEFDVVKDVAIEVSKELYKDGGTPIVKPTGELVGLIPRAIKAAMLPLEKWIVNKEYNLSETKKLLEVKLENIDPESIESPEPHVAVPALEYISYCLDNEELRDMYANLLANSMNSVMKNGVHPSFVEVIKQLSPDEAKILKEIYKRRTIPSVDIKYMSGKGGGITIISNFSDIGEKAKCDEPLSICMYFDNLARLGLIECDSQSSFTDKSKYDEIRDHPEIIKNLKISPSLKEKGYTESKIGERVVIISYFGIAFSEICLTIK